MDKKYDLEERTAEFSERIMRLADSVQANALNKSIVSQLVRSSSSIGANYCEAIEGESKKDFIHKMSVSKKEIRETKYWLRLLVTSNPEIREVAVGAWKEAHELLLIFAKIVRTSKLKSN
jgi:four helix bundle protein